MTSDDGQTHPLEWIDEYVARLREYVVVREEDRLLIKVPNEAHKLNESGVRVLKRLLDGESVLELWRSHGGTPEVRRDLYQFFIGLKQVLQGCLDERRLPEAVSQRPFTLGFNTLPVLSEVALTYRCNLECAFCYAGCSCTKGSGDGHEMTTEEVRTVLRTIREDAEVPSVSFTGGEPTLRDDLPDLIRHARHDLGLGVNLITNGTTMNDSLASRLGDAGLHSAQVSIESPDNAVHDGLTSVDGSHGRTLEGIAALQAHGIRVHTNTTINRANWDTVTGMPSFVQGLGLERFSMNLVIPAGTSRDESDSMNVRYADVPELILGIQGEAERNGVEFMWYSPTPMCLFNPLAEGFGNKSCAACDGLLSISPSGDVLPCSSYAEPVGNLLREPFQRVWQSAAARFFRQKEYAPGECDGCDDFTACAGACPLYWSAMGTGELARTERGRHVTA